MKKIIQFTFFLLISGIATAQMPMMGGMGGGAGAPSITGNISGTILDSLSSAPISYATISLFKANDSKLVNGIIADEKGFFKLQNVKNGTYKVVINFMGYKTLTFDSIKLTPAKPDYKFRKISLPPSATSLKEVEVTAQSSLIENRADKIVYNAEKDITSQTGTAEDILRKVPMVTVDQDGNVQLRGNGNVKVLINGKPSSLMAASVADAMKLIPSDQIKSVEVITNPSAKYEAEGNAGIINIITKKKDMQGFNGSVNTAIGTRQNNMNGSLNYKNGRFGITSNFGGNWSWPQTSRIEVYKKNLDSAKNVIVTNQNGSSSFSRGGGRGQIGFDYDVNSYHNISSTVTLNGYTTDNSGKLSSYNAATPDQINKQTTSSLFLLKGFDWTTDYKHTAKRNKDEELTASFQLSRSENTNHSDINTNLGTTPFVQNNYNTGINREMTSQLDYTLPLNKKITVETGLKNILRKISSDYYSILNGTHQNANDNNFIYTQDVYAAYLSTTLQLPKEFSIKAGIRNELTMIGSSSKIDSIKALANRYNNPVPSLTITKNFKQGKSLKLGYSQRIQRPSLYYLNPYVNKTNNTNITYGNPSLKPELTHSFELGYSSFWKGIFITSSIFYKHTYDVIESVLTVDSGISKTTYRNNSNTNSYGFNTFGSVTLFKKLTIRGNANVYYDQIRSVNTSKTNQGIAYSGNAMATLELPKGLNFETFSFFNSPRRTLQGYNPSFSMINFGLRKDLFKKKISIGITATNPFFKEKSFISELGDKNLIKDNSYQYSDFSIPFRSFGISFRWQFGKIDFKAPKKKGINNDDLKQGSDGNGGGQ